MRFFYSEPLAAAWMAKHFGMRFHDGSGHRGEDEINPVFRGNEIYWHFTQLNGFDQHLKAICYKPYVHPDSIKLVTWAQQNDVLAHVITDERGPRPELYLARKAFELEANEKIIERGGIVFMMPEKENA